MARKKAAKGPTGGMRGPAMSIDIGTGFTKLVTNTAIIAQHVEALKLVAKGVDVEPIKKANEENQNLLVALASFMNREGLGKSGGPGNRKQRRAAERIMAKAQKKGSKKTKKKSKK